MEKWRKRRLMDGRMVDKKGFMYEMRGSGAGILVWMICVEDEK